MSPRTKISILAKVLSIAWYKILPPVFGGQKGIANFNKYLAASVPLVCLCSGNNEPDEPLPYVVIPGLPTSRLQFINPFCWKKIKAVARTEKVSHIILEHPYHAIGAWFARKATGAVVIVHSHNIESERFRLLGKWWWRLLYYYEKWAHRRAGHSLFKTGADMDFAIRHFKLDPARCSVIPYGISESRVPADAVTLVRKKHGIADTDKILLFAGTLDYAPNAKAVENIFSVIAPALQKTGLSFRIILCGRNRSRAFAHLKKLSHPSVIWAGEVPDIDTYFGAADVFINPVQYGGGIQTKNIDALSYHCNVVCFRQMAADIPVEICGNKLLAVETTNWDDFVQAINKAICIDEQTPDTFFTYFDWKNIVAGFARQLASGDIS